MKSFQFWGTTERSKIDWKCDTMLRYNTSMETTKRETAQLGRYKREFMVRLPECLYNRLRLITQERNMSLSLAVNRAVEYWVRGEERGPELKG